MENNIEIFKLFKLLLFVKDIIYKNLWIIICIYHFSNYYLLKRKKSKAQVTFENVKKDVTINLPLDSTCYCPRVNSPLTTRPSRTSREGQGRGNVVHRLQPHTR